MKGSVTRRATPEEYDLRDRDVWLQRQELYKTLTDKKFEYFASPSRPSRFLDWIEGRGGVELWIQYYGHRHFIENEYHRDDCQGARCVCVLATVDRRTNRR